eukprot:3622135-Rhodomonas_salina.1
MQRAGRYFPRVSCYAMWYAMIGTDLGDAATRPRAEGGRRLRYTATVLCYDATVCCYASTVCCYAAPICCYGGEVH